MSVENGVAFVTTTTANGDTASDYISITVLYEAADSASAK